MEGLKKKTNLEGKAEGALRGTSWAGYCCLLYGDQSSVNPDLDNETCENLIFFTMESCRLPQKLVFMSMIKNNVNSDFFSPAASTKKSGFGLNKIEIENAAF